ncbi:MAG: hypothetical protein ACLQHF_15435 [Terracidiphilus sp.]
MIELPEAVLAEEISSQIRIIGQAWANSSIRPRILPELKHHWDDLIDQWAESELPLVVRKSSGVRGQEVRHSGGRGVVISDNSPAQWAFLMAFRRSSYTLNDIRRLLECDNIPFAFATKTKEKVQMKYKRTLAPSESINKRNWKFCHIKEVGLNSRAPVNEIPLETLKEKFRLLLKPSNQFLVPIGWSGLGELPEVIEELRRVEGSDKTER